MRVQRRMMMRLREERGAQVAEYALLGGVSAGACAALLAAMKAKDGLPRLVTTILRTVAEFVSSWF